MTSDAPTLELQMSPGRRTRSLALLLIHISAIGVFLGIVWPLMSLVMERQGVDASLIGIMSAMGPAAIMATMFFARPVLARGRPILLMVAGVAVGLLILVLMALYQQIELWIPFRLIMGIGIGFPWLIGETLINILAEERRRGRVVAAYAVMFFLGMAVGPLLLDAVGSEGLLPWICSCLALVGSGLPLLFIRGLEVDLRPPHGGSIGGLLRAAPMLMTAGLLAGLTELTVYSFAPIFGLRSGLGEDAAVRLLTAFTVGAIVLQPVIGLAADRVNRRILLTIFGFSTAVLAALLPLASGSALWTTAVFFFLGSTSLAFYSVGLTLLGQRFRGGELALANASFILMYTIGAIIGPFLSGAGMEAIGPSGFVLVIGGGGLLFALLGLGRLSLAGRA